MPRRRLDRAQTLRTRRIWWERHGPFVRGLVTGVLLALVAVWIARSVLGRL